MIKKIKIIFIIISSLILSVSCEDKAETKSQVDNNQSINKKDVAESLEKANRYLIIQESELIEDYIERHELNVIQTGTGLRYQIINQGEGDLIREGNVVKLEYEVRLLNGDLVYSSKNDGVKTFLVGRGGVESGLEEAILKLRLNSTAVLILPAHLAHGLIGDGNKVKMSLKFRGREISHQSVGERILLRVISEVEDIAKPENTLKLEGKQMTVTLAPISAK